MQVFFTPQAEAALEEMGDYIAADNPDRAVSFIREIRQHCGDIAAAPSAHPLRPALGSNIRSCVHGRYLIFFTARADQDDVLIVRILHGARNLPAIFEGTA